MQHRPLIYVSRITNLSDARYCAGMGVDMLGFVIDPDHKDFVSPTTYREMIGWVSGPKRVIEIGDAKKIDFTKAVEDYAPDFIHVSLGYGSMSQLPSDIPLILDVKFESWLSEQKRIDGMKENIEFILLTGIPSSYWQSPQALQSRAGLLLSLEGGTIPPASILEQTGTKGFGLHGTKELAPGLKDYDHLSKVLESLES